MSTKTHEEKMRHAIDKAKERLTQAPDPRTGRPLTVDQATKRAHELADAQDAKRRAPDLDTKN